MARTCVPGGREKITAWKKEWPKATASYWWMIAKTIFCSSSAVQKIGLNLDLHVARDGDEAIRYLVAGVDERRAAFPPYPKFILLDSRMPLMSGNEFLQWLMDNPRYKVIRTIVLSGSSSPEEVRRAYALGIHTYFSKPGTLAELEALPVSSWRFGFVFLSMDASEQKRQILAFLVEKGIPFVDCGLGIQQEVGKLMGIVRATTVTPHKNDHCSGRISCVETAEDDYASNIQIAELNMLNATLAVIRWKKWAEFYVDFEREHHTTYPASGDMLLSEDTVKRYALPNTFVDLMPDVVEEGVLYISLRFCIVSHKCCCGCGEEAFINLSPRDWQMTFGGETISITLSEAVGSSNANRITSLKTTECCGLRGGELPQVRNTIGGKSFGDSG
jgi:CheY-like chemotaxis protein